MSSHVSGVHLLLKQARREAGLSQADLARRLGVSQVAVAKLERPGANPTVDTLDRALWAAGWRLALDVTPRRAGGVDESLIRRQLELTPAERIAGIEETYRQARALQSAGEAARARQS
jgi:transcriptional regulator with XRE-family HTH domain